MSVRITKKKDVVKNTDFGHVLKCNNYGTISNKTLIDIKLENIMNIFISLFLLIGMISTFIQGVFVEKKDTIITFCCGIAFTIMFVMFLHINFSLLYKNLLP